jgi:DNA polymerase-3 subunit epsilon/ATP-dependent DNA helicase DinG
MPNMVALDIETTGLDPTRDSILEIGAIRFNGRRIEDEWFTLINPGRAIPQFITQLTGITNNMVAQAPPLSAVLSDLNDFVGDLPILGHSIGFDMSFLRRYGSFKRNKTLDTYEMASVLIPSAGRYNLAALAQALAVPLPVDHRALGDARAAHGVYLRLHEIALDLPLELLSEIVEISEPLEWGGYWAFRLALAERSRQPVQARFARGDHSGPLFGPKSAAVATKITAITT